QREPPRHQLPQLLLATHDPPHSRFAGLAPTNRQGTLRDLRPDGTAPSLPAAHGRRKRPGVKIGVFSRSGWSEVASLAAGKPLGCYTPGRRGEGGPCSSPVPPWTSPAGPSPPRPAACARSRSTCDTSLPILTDRNASR